MEPRSTLISVTSLNADFARLLLSISHILSNSSNQQDNLKKCKDFCLFLKVNEGSSGSLFSAKKIAEIKECKNFIELLGIISQYMSWDEHSILTQIVDECNSDEGKQEIEKFDKKMALYEGLQIISSTSNQTLSEDFVKLCIVIDKPFKNITPKEYKKVKAYIRANLNIKAYTTARFIRMLYHSLHIEWLVTIQAVPHMIRTANQSKNEFLKEKFVFMKIGSEIVIDHKVCTSFSM